jgi:hypothetical protein
MTAERAPIDARRNKERRRRSEWRADFVSATKKGAAAE